MLRESDRLIRALPCIKNNRERLPVARLSDKSGSFCFLIGGIMNISDIQRCADFFQEHYLKTFYLVITYDTKACRESSTNSRQAFISHNISLSFKNGFLQFFLFLLFGYFFHCYILSLRICIDYNRNLLAAGTTEFCSVSKLCSAFWTGFGSS